VRRDRRLWEPHQLGDLVVIEAAVITEDEASSDLLGQALDGALQRLRGLAGRGRIAGLGTGR